MLTAQQAIKVMRVLIVEPQKEQRAVFAAKLAHEGYEKIFYAENGEKALSLMADLLMLDQPVDLVWLNLDLPDRPGLECFHEIRNIYDVALALFVGREERQLVMDAVRQEADDYLMWPGSLELLLLKTEKLLTRRFMQKELRRSTTRNETLFLNVLAVMAKVLEAKDPDTRFHSEQVSMWSRRVAREMGFQDDEVRRIGIAGILHDIGKLGIPDSILRKPGPLLREEREIVERHPIIASTILEPIEQLRGAVGYVKYHHEHYDGSGYPEHLSGDQIPLGARIIHATEAFDAMISPRSYCVKRTVQDALSELQRCAKKQFDPKVVEALAAVIKRSDEMANSASRPAQSLPEMLEGLTGQVSA